jgi:hypothetical protein
MDGNLETDSTSYPIFMAHEGQLSPIACCKYIMTIDRDYTDFAMIPVTLYRHPSNWSRDQSSHAPCTWRTYSCHRRSLRPLTMAILVRICWVAFLTRKRWFGSHPRCTFYVTAIYRWCIYHFFLSLFGLQSCNIRTEVINFPSYWSFGPDLCLQKCLNYLLTIY